MGSRASILDYLKERDWSSGIHPNSHPFAPKQQPWHPPRSKEIKLGAKKLLKSEEAKRCELKP
jgi:hypothetical protein